MGNKIVVIDCGGTATKYGRVQMKLYVRCLISFFSGISLCLPSTISFCGSIFIGVLLPENSSGFKATVCTQFIFYYLGKERRWLYAHHHDFINSYSKIAAKHFTHTKHTIQHMLNLWSTLSLYWRFFVVVVQHPYTYTHEPHV